MHPHEILERRIIELQSEIAHFRAKLAKIPPGSRSADNQIAKRMLEGLILGRQAELARAQRRLACMLNGQRSGFALEETGLQAAAQSAVD
ncbi:MAG: hypothetical protein AB7U81_14815 [Thiohalomonadaceae bacterium]